MESTRKQTNTDMMDTSAVFASSYRTWVLFNYSKDDISYTLTPLLVWSDIEMCAGVISACLPTMRPVVIWVGQKLGVNHCLPFRRGESRAGKETNATTNSNHTAGSGNPRSHQAQAESTYRTESRTAFYRLHDDSEADSIMMDAAERGSVSRLKLELGKQFRVSTIQRGDQSSTERLDKEVDTDGHSQDTSRTATDDIQLHPKQKQNTPS